MMFRNSPTAAMPPTPRTAAVALALASLVTLCGRTAAADEPSDRDRVIHAAAISAMATGYLVVQFGFAGQLAAQNCRWCDPPSLDASTRSALKWGDTGRADRMSSITGYALAPATLLGLAAYGSGRNATWRRRVDDVVPVVESALAVALLQHVSKFAVGRQRPFAHYARSGTLVPTQEDNVSFFSGHTALTFGLAVSAGRVASLRGYAIAPGIWVLGLSLATTTAYLRVAADRHYLTDVVAGAIVGSAVGYGWPRFVTRYLHRELASLVPTPTGVAVVGAF